jgi:hypothetical protein
MSVADILIVLGNENRLLDNQELKRNFINCRSKILTHQKMLTNNLIGEKNRSIKT